MLRKPNIRLSTHPRRPQRHVKPDTKDLKSIEDKEESVAKQGDGLSDSGTAMEEDEKSDVDLGVRREKKYSFCSSMEEFHSKRSAAYFEELSTSSISEGSISKESAPPPAEMSESFDSGKMTVESENNWEEYSDEEDDEEDISPNLLLYRYGNHNAL